MAIVVKRDTVVELFYKHALLGARADEAHVAAQNVPKLGQLVQTRFTDKFAHAGDAGIANLGKLRAVCFGVFCHAAKFVDGKFAPALPDAVLGEQRAASAFQHHRQRGEAHQRQGKRQADDDERDVHDAFDEHIGGRGQQRAEVVFVEMADFYAPCERFFYLADVVHGDVAQGAVGKKALPCCA